MAAVTAQSMILSSLRMLGEKTPGGTLSAEEKIDYLADLISSMDSWGLDPLNSYAVTEDSKALTTGIGSYTIGSGATWSTARPSKIIGAFIRDASSIDTPVAVIDEESYREISLKSNGNSTPRALWYNPAFVTGFATIDLYPLPSAGLTLYIHSPKQLQTFAAITDALVLPPGYQLFIESNFAIRLAAGFTPASPELIKTARDARAAIQSTNIPARHMRLDAGLLQSNRRVGRTGSILTEP